MTLAEEASRSIQGAWGLFRRDPAAPAAFNATAEGCWRSFAAIALMLPVLIVYRLAAGSVESAASASPFLRWSLEILSFVIAWLLWPLAAFYLTRALGCADRYLGYVAAYNWAQVILMPFYFGVSLVCDAWLTQELAAAVTFAAMVTALFLEFQIARQMLSLPPGRAALMVVASLAPGIIVYSAAQAALQIGAEPAPFL